MGWRALGVFSDLDPPLLGRLLVNSPCLLLSLIPVLALCCACLQKPEQGCLSHRSAALPPYGPPLQSHPVVSHTIITNSPWLAPQVSSHWCLRHNTLALLPSLLLHMGRLELWLALSFFLGSPLCIMPLWVVGEQYIPLDMDGVMDSSEHLGGVEAFWHEFRYSWCSGQIKEVYQRVQSLSGSQCWSVPQGDKSIAVLLETMACTW